MPEVEWEGEVEVEMDWVGVRLPRGVRDVEGLREGEADVEGVLDTFPEGETLPVLVPPPPPPPPSEVTLGDTDWEGVSVSDWLEEGDAEAQGVGVVDPPPHPPPPVAKGVKVTQAVGELDPPPPPPPPEERGVVDTQDEEEGVEPSLSGLELGLPVPTAADAVNTREPVYVRVAVELLAGEGEKRGEEEED